MTAAIRLDHLRKVYPGASTAAVDGITLEVAEGSLYGLLGPNGAGKTTTIGICTTRILATGGTATVAGLDVRREAVALRARIGVASQAVTLDHSLTVVENLYYHCRYFGFSRADSRKRSGELLERFQVADRRDHLPEQLSGGLAQRVQLARAIAHRPQVLFLDEPTAGLDPQSRLVLWQLVASLRDEGITVLLTTHYMEEADRLCDRLAIVDRGRILAEGSPGELKARAGNSTVVDAVLAEPAAEIEAVVAALPGVQEVRSSDNGLRVRVSQDQVAAVIAAIAPHRLLDLRVTEPSLETAFIALTGRDLRE